MQRVMARMRQHQRGSAADWKTRNAGPMGRAPVPDHPGAARAARIAPHADRRASREADRCAHRRAETSYPPASSTWWPQFAPVRRAADRSSRGHRAEPAARILWGRIAPDHGDEGAVMSCRQAGTLSDGHFPYPAQRDGGRNRHSRSRTGSPGERSPATAVRVDSAARSDGAFRGSRRREGRRHSSWFASARRRSREVCDAGTRSVTVRVPVDRLDDRRAERPSSSRRGTSHDRHLWAG